MKKYFIKSFVNIFVLLIFAIILSASELSYVGTAPITKETESGIGFSMLSGSTGTFSVDTNNIYMELFYRKCNVESFDWGFSLYPMPVNSLPGTPNFLFDLKARLLKGSSILPSISLGIDMVTIESNWDFSNLTANFVFLREGRIGLSWEFVSYEGGREGDRVEVKRNIVYVGTNIQPGSSTLGNRVYAGAKFGSLNLTLVLLNGISSIGLGYCF